MNYLILLILISIKLIYMYKISKEPKYAKEYL